MVIPVKNCIVSMVATVMMYYAKATKLVRWLADGDKMKWRHERT
jgi:hypothetical protein